MDDKLKAIEEQLEKLTATAMPEDMLARMEKAMARWEDHTSAEDVIVPFEVPTTAPKKAPMHAFGMWASAAAVTLIGAVSYLVMQGGPMQDAEIATTEPFVPQAPTIVEKVPAQNIANVVPASHSNFRNFETQVTHTGDEVIGKDANGRPVRLMRVEFEDEVTVRDRDGKIYKVKQPRVEYYALPVEMH